MSKLAALKLGVSLATVALFNVRAEQVLISEIMYHPRPAQPEWIEIHNSTSTAFDIAQWRLRGAVDFEFPAFSATNPTATFLQSWERIVISSSDPITTRQAYGIPADVRVFGPWQGNLSNGGERITLEDKNGIIACTVEYNDRGKWPISADGAGHSLVLKTPNKTIDDWRVWKASARAGGTPGAQPIEAFETPIASPELSSGDGIALIEYGHVWKFHDANQDLGSVWRNPDYNDTAWSAGPGLLGFENSTLPAPGIQTPFRDMDQLTYYLRKEFQYEENPAGVRVMLDQIVDDGALYFLNGQEIGRIGIPGGTVSFGTSASRTVSNASEERNVIQFTGAPLRQGRNVLAVEVHQTGPSSSDVVFGARLRVSAPTGEGLLINEFSSGPSGFIELYNPTAAPVNLKGHFLTDNPGNLRKFTVTSDLVIPSRGLGIVALAETGFTASNPQAIYVVAPDGVTVINAISATLPGDGRSIGRKPAGGGSWYLFVEPTPGAPNFNQASLAEVLSLNEVHFSDTGTVDWIEIFNKGDTAVDLEGLHLSSQRDFRDRMPLTGTIAPGGVATFDVAFPAASEVTIYLLNTGGTVVDGGIFDRPVLGDNWQTFPDGSDAWYTGWTGTKEDSNRVLPNRSIIINEILFDPPFNHLEGEFIELFNRGTAEVDLSGWRFTDGINFTIPLGTTVPPGGHLVIAGNAEWIQRVYGDIPVIGNFNERLRNGGELIRLEDAWGNLIDQVDYRPGGNWPDFTNGDGSSMELINPWMENDFASAWGDSIESSKTTFKRYAYTGVYRQLAADGAVTDHKELHFHLVGDGHVILRNIALRENGTGPNIIRNGTSQSFNGSGSSGWLAQGTHQASFVRNDELHVISSGHGDNRPNRVEIDAVDLTSSRTYELSFEAKWVWGTPRLIGQTWDHSIGDAFLIEIPNRLGTPGAQNSRFQSSPAPQADALAHSPAVPTSSDAVNISARITAAAPIASVLLFHRVDSAAGNVAWQSTLMNDTGENGDSIAGDGIYSVELTEHQVAGRIVQFYVAVRGQDGQTSFIPKWNSERPAMYVVDTPENRSDLRTARFIVSEYDLQAIRNGETQTYNYRFPRLSNHYKNMTFISNEEEIYYGCEIRHSGSPWTRGQDLSRGKWKMPKDNLFRGREKFTFDNDPTAGRGHHNRITRYWLYLLGHPVNQNEFIHVIVNSGGPQLREETEPVANDLLDRNFENGTQGELYRIDDEWWFRDDWSRNSRNADWSYKGTDSPIRYHTEWMKRSREDEYDYTTLINFFKTASGQRYSQSEIERFVDSDAILKMAAVRGYIQDWDSFTLSRGKNGYFYRRPSDGKFMFLHWDSDLAFQNASGPFYGSLAGVRHYIERPYNIRRFYYYLAEMIDLYTLNSPRIEAWFQAEERASTSYSIDAGFYRNWFSSRRSYALGTMGANYSLPFSVNGSGGIQTSQHRLTLTGAAPYKAFEVEVENHPEAVLTWTTATTWSLSGIVLRTGNNPLAVRALDQWGRVVAQTIVNVVKTGNAPPVVAWHSTPASGHLEVNKSLDLDATGSFDPDGDALEFEWNVQPPGMLSTSTEIPGRASLAFSRPGLYTATLRIRDVAGSSTEESREFAVFDQDGFTSFSSKWLEGFWELENVGPRVNYSPDNWFSLTDVPGHLVMQVYNSKAQPLASASATGLSPIIWRPLPDGTNWVFQTKLDLETTQFGTFQTGLIIEAHENGQPSRYAFSLQNGSFITVRKYLNTGTSSSLHTSLAADDKVALRIQRAGSSLHFQIEKENGSWSTLHSVALGSDSALSRGGVFVATDFAQSVRVRFDYTILIDPSRAPKLRDLVRISEIMYNPMGGDAFEFVELANIGAEPADLTGAAFIEGISFVFDTTILSPGERIVLAKDFIALQSRYGAENLRLANGTFAGRLDNGGETLTLADATGATILSITYGDSDPWPVRADGYGSSIELLNLASLPNDPDSWRASTKINGTPGDIPAPAYSIVINELLAGADAPQETAIELINTGTSPVEIGGWFLSHTLDDLKKFQIPNGIVLPAGGYQVFYEHQFKSQDATAPFALTSGEANQVYLTAKGPDGEPAIFVDTVTFGPAPNGVSLGRYPEGTGGLALMTEPTFGVHVYAGDPPEWLHRFRKGSGAPNSSPRTGPVVISEIMYHPKDGGDEFIRISNITGMEIPLFDITNPTNTWSLAGAITFSLPPGTVIPPNGELIISAIDPTLFRTKYSIKSTVEIVGPFSGQLNNGGEILQLLQPSIMASGDDANQGLAPKTLVEEIAYDDELPWPREADGGGASLQKRVLNAYGNQPQNWSAQAPDRVKDSDADGLVNEWELLYGLNPNSPEDALNDLDADGMTNLDEFRAATDPSNPSSVFLLRFSRISEGSVHLRLVVSPGRSYRVQQRTVRSSDPWEFLQQLEEQTTSGHVLVHDQAATNSQIYQAIVDPR